jgi:cell fate regulator YaaT (PSP1 superfamily)
VVFSPGGKVYTFDPGDLQLAWNAKVICQTSRGREYGRVVQPLHAIPDTETAGHLKRVLRVATQADEDQVRENREQSKRAMAAFREAIKKHGVAIKPISAEVTFDGSRLVFSYSSETRVETRRLQDELSRLFRARVELRAVGPREEARLCGGFGLCGGQLCCTRFPSHEQPITLRMAKDQDLSVSSGRITGLCGRLRCCLAYEHPLYRSFRDRAPRVGRRVETPHGVGVVKSYEVLKDACSVEYEGERILEVKVDDCRELEEAAEPRQRRRRRR